MLTSVSIYLIKNYLLSEYIHIACKGGWKLIKGTTKKSNIEDILEAIHVLENIYDVVRIVDPVQNQVIHLKTNSIPITYSDESCYGLWEKGRFCENCISLRAVTEMGTFVKFEVVNERIYMITASPVEHQDGHYAIEMLNDITDKSILESIIGNDKKDFTSFVLKFNDALVRDELTQLFNRRYINERLPVEIFQSLAMKKRVTLIMADIDEFKNMNDQHGHIAGDMVLQTFANLLARGLRSTDDWAARYGGEEFLLCLHDVNDDEALEVSEQVRSLVENTKFKIPNGTVNITCSLGICTLSVGMNMQEWIDGADKKLYLAKSIGGNKVF